MCVLGGGWLFPYTVLDSEYKTILDSEYKIT